MELTIFRQFTLTRLKPGAKAEENFFFDEIKNYDFTPAASQTYGNNQTLVGSKYCIYSGDINQDNVIDAQDLAILDNDFIQCSCRKLSCIRSKR